VTVKAQSEIATPHTPAKQATPMRLDIQALRAIAVGVVLVYHFWPTRVTGGYVGVDVFFVISGFLITSHLVRKPPQNVKDVAIFWARRIRRLLPLSFTVLALSLLATFFIAPVTVWTQTFKEVIASAFYVQNWLLAGQAIDYLAADNAASPVQHFWSLSVEEQFYLIWPIIAFLAVLLAAKLRKNFKAILAVALLLLTVSSLIYAINAVNNADATAYFVSTARVWELGIGSLLAIAKFAWPDTSRLPWLRSGLGWVGLAMIFGSALMFDAATPFPGASALIPTLGTVLVIAAHVPDQGYATPLYVGKWRPVQYIGDISYGIYLWHWPILIFMPFVFTDGLTVLHRVGGVALSIALAGLTKPLIEDRFRSSKSMGGRTSGAFVFMAVGIAILGVVAGGGAYALHQKEVRAERELEQAMSGENLCFGGQALVNEGCKVHGEKLLTEPAFAKEDKPAAYADECWVLGDFSSRKVCHYGVDDAEATAKIALVGNSHAGHWLPLLDDIAQKEGYSIDTYLISECYTVFARVQFENETKTANCNDWNNYALGEATSSAYDAVVMSQRTWRPIEGIDAKDSKAQRAAQEDAYREVLAAFDASGTPLLVLRDTPYASDLKNVPDCVATHADDLSQCDGTDKRKVVDPLADVAQAATPSPLLSYLDLTDRICKDSTCYSTVGGVIVYFDLGHMTATFARSLTPDVQGPLAELVAQAHTS